MAESLIEYGEKTQYGHVPKSEKDLLKKKKNRIRFENVRNHIQTKSKNVSIYEDLYSF